MRVCYEYFLRSEIKLTDETFPVLSFTRDGCDVAVHKPIARSGPYLSAAMVLPFQAVTAAPDLVQDIGASIIRIEVDSPQCEDQNQVGKIIGPVAQEVIRDLIPWIRVLTRQYWIGRTDRDRMDQRLSVKLVDGAQSVPLSTGMVGLAFNYGTPLSTQIWADIGAKMAGAASASPSLLFFCDALIDIIEQDIPQAVVGLGVSCELEIHSLLEDILARRSSEFRTLFFKYARFTFSDEIRLIAEFGGESFADVDQESARLVNVLYGMRGQAIHRGQCSYKEQGTTVTMEVNHLPKFVRAVESFFSWCENEKGRNL